MGRDVKLEIVVGQTKNPVWSVRTKYLATKDTTIPISLARKLIQSISVYGLIGSVVWLILVVIPKDSNQDKLPSTRNQEWSQLEYYEQKASKMVEDDNHLKMPNINSDTEFHFDSLKGM